MSDAHGTGQGERTPLTIGITTRNRPAALRRCVASIRDALGPPGAGLELLVFDDNSDVPAVEQLGDAPPGFRVIRDSRGIGYIAGRNALVRAASHDLVLLLDDDAVLLEASGIERAIAVMERDARAGAVAFAQAGPDGRPWPESMQPGKGAVDARVPSFIGFAHLIRRSLFLEKGGYRADFVFYGEEKDYCLRLLEAGYRVVYLPNALIGHVIDGSERDPRRYVRFVIRNDVLQSLYNEPWPLVAVGLPIRLLRYRRMAASIPGGDKGGLRWIIAEIRRTLPDVRRGRRPVSWSTIREWRRLSRTIVPYEAGSPA